MRISILVKNILSEIFFTNFVFFLIKYRMTKILEILYQQPNDYQGLLNSSHQFPFTINNKQYPSVNHFLFCELTHHEFDSILLTSRNVQDVYNKLSNEQYFQVLSTIIQKGITSTLTKTLENYLKSKMQNYYYYITNDNIFLGINEKGFGFNLVGKYYSRLYNRFNSSFYQINQYTIYEIYKTKELLLHHFQNGYDIAEFIGKSIDEIQKELPYPNFKFDDSDHIWSVYLKDPYKHYIQFEIDYPLNLAGFIRRDFIQYFNYYLRSRFNTLMIRSYFKYLLQTDFADVIDVSKLNDYIHQQMNRLDVTNFEKLSNRLYYLYNDPYTNEKTHSFLSYSIRKELYDIEINFMNKNDIKTGQSFIPFLYHIKVDHSMYIYDTPEQFDFDPYITELSPNETNLNEYIYTNLAKWYDNTYTKKCYDYTSLLDIIQGKKIKIMNIGMNAKFESTIFSRYLLCNTRQFESIIVCDAESSLNNEMLKSLIRLRDGYLQKDIMYSILLNFTNNIYFQDRLKYRLLDFKNCFDSYIHFRDIKAISKSDYIYIEESIYKDPFIISKKKKNIVSDHFNSFFHNICEKDVIDQLWEFSYQYIELLEKFSNHISLSKNENSNDDLPAILSYFVDKFYSRDKENEFYLFVIQVMTGNKQSFTPSLSYYSSYYDKKFSKYLTFENYSPEFIVNLFGICNIIKKNISSERLLYFSYLKKPENPNISSFSLYEQINKKIHSTKTKTVPIKKPQKNKKEKILQKISETKQTHENDEEEQQELNIFQQDDIDLKELGLESEEEDEDIEQEEDENID